MNMNFEEPKNLVYCAGGLVWRDGAQGREVLLILSRDDRAWKLPKGHIDATDASWDAAAQREVKEETGYDTRILDFAGFTKYPVKAREKLVLYWHMSPVGESDFAPCDEIECYEWLNLRAAVDRLTYIADKRLLLGFIPASDDQHLYE